MYDYVYRNVINMIASFDPNTYAPRPVARITNLYFTFSFLFITPKKCAYIYEKQIWACIESVCLVSVFVRWMFCILDKEVCSGV